MGKKKIHAINTHALPANIADIMRWRKDDMEIFDVKIQKFLTIHLISTSLISKDYTP